MVFCSNDDPGWILTFLTARSNFVTLAFHFQLNFECKLVDTRE